MRAVLAICLGFVLAAVVAEIGLRQLPVTSSLRLLPVNAAQPILHGTPHLAYTYSVGWDLRAVQRGRLNNWGFNSVRDYRREEPPPIALIGDSYVQASAIAQGRDLAALLDRTSAAPGHVYGFGVSGAALADYLAISQWAHATFNVGRVLLLLTGDDIAASVHAKPGGYHLAEHDGEYVLTRSDNPRRYLVLAEWLNRSALFRYCFDNLQFAATLTQRAPTPKLAVFRPPRAAITQLPSATTAACPPADPHEQRLLAYFVRALTALQASGVEVELIIDPPRRFGGVSLVGCPPDLERLAAAAEPAGITVHRLREVFADAASRGVRLDFLPADAHWTAAAHALAAAQIARDNGWQTPVR